MKACTSLTTRGYPCRARALRGSEYCAAHQRVECIGGPWDGLTVSYGGTMFVMSYDPSVESPWSGWSPDSELTAHGTYTRRGDAWQWERTTEREHREAEA